MKISKKFYDFVYFIFTFINGLKTLFPFLHFKFMTTLLLFFSPNCRGGDERGEGGGAQIANFGKKTPQFLLIIIREKNDLKTTPYFRKS